jgi:hypothetical protein
MKSSERHHSLLLIGRCISWYREVSQSHSQSQSRREEKSGKDWSCTDCYVKMNTQCLVRVDVRPEATLHAIDEGEHAVGIGKVDEGVPNVAAGLEIDLETQEVVGAERELVVLVDAVDGRPENHGEAMEALVVHQVVESLCDRRALNNELV